MSDLFTADPAATTADKYSTWDLEALKNKALAADMHIKAIEAENAALRENTDTQTKLEEILASLDKVNQPITSPFQPSTTVNQTVPEKPQTSSVTKENLAEMVSAIISNNQKQSTAKTNVDIVKRKLSETWGTNFSKTLQDKTEELGLTQDAVSILAETNPNALFKLILDEKQTNPNTHLPTHSTTRVDTSTTGQLNKWSDFSKAMKDNPRLRNDAMFQRKLHETAEKVGDTFFN